MSSLETALESLEQAIDLSAPYNIAADSAREVAIRVRERARFEGDRVVVALAGSTGSGKSSLMNALAGAEIARVAATRPTTTRAQAASAHEASQLLDWLEVKDRMIADMPGLDQNVVIVDLPDLDSIEMSHRGIADSIIERADVVIFVMDPQKYADAVVHRDYLPRFSEHRATTFVVINQIDRVGQGDREELLSHARALLADSGARLDVVATSASTGEGLAQLRAHINDVVRRHEASRARGAADIRRAAAELGEANAADGGKELDRKMSDFAPTAEAMARAAGADVLTRAAADSYRVRSRRVSRPVWQRVKHLDDPLDTVQALGSLSPAHLGRARLAVRSYVETNLAALPRAWRSGVVENLDAKNENILRSMVDAHSIDTGRDRRPAWWSLARALWTLLFVVGVLGGVWIGLYALQSYVMLRLPEPPYVGWFSLPLLMVIAAVGLSILLGLCVRFLRGRGASRVERSTRRQVEQMLEERSRAQIIEPVMEARKNYGRFLQVLAEAREGRA